MEKGLVTSLLPQVVLISSIKQISSSISLIVIVIAFYLPSCLGQETAKGPFWCVSQAATSPLVYHTWWRLYTVPFIAKRQAGKL